MIPATDNPPSLGRPDEQNDLLNFDPASWDFGTFPIHGSWDILAPNKDIPIFSSLASTSETTNSPHPYSTIPLFSKIPPQIPSHSQYRALPEKPLNKASAQIPSKLLRRILGSYPEMMLRTDTFPPFIHPRLFAQLPEALVNCMSLVQIFAHKTRENSRLLWRTMRMEQERLWIEVSIPRVLREMYEDLS
jgi:hypothetical protein